MVKTIIIGHKEHVAIEYALQGTSGKDFIKARLWLSGVAVGSLDEEVYLPSFRAALQRMETLPELKTGLDPSRPFIPQLDAQAGVFIISLGDTFDDFSLRGFREGDDLVLVSREYVGNTPGLEQRTRAELRVWKDLVQAFQTALKG